MNILIPHSWLLEHLETTATPEELQREVSLCGPSIERIYDREGDSVYDIEITTNRVDSMSVRGVAREAAIILTKAGFPSRLKPLKHSFQELVSSAAAHSELPLPIVHSNPSLCSRTLCSILSNIERTATPDWMAKRLRQVELNVHDSVIDITNYVTHDLGHPCHAFDYDKIMSLGGEINITEAGVGEKFTTLDGVQYETKGGEVVFKNPSGEIIDLPAIKGTLNTSVNESTKNVLFWIETIDAKKVRQASMSHAIRTVAAQLNEKKVDPHAAEPVFAAATNLYHELCGAQLASAVHDDFPNSLPPQAITFPLSDVERYLGLTLPTSEIIEILSALECTVEDKGDTLLITPPSFRPDLEISADVIEEIARIYGYHRLPSEVMPTRIPLDYPSDVDFSLENKVKQFLAHLGWQELYTYSLVSEAVALESGWQAVDHLKLQNPLTDDHIYLRRSLVPSLIEVVSMTSTPKPASVFEIANVYHPQEHDVPHHELHLTLVSQQAYRDVRGVLELLLEKLFIDNVLINPIDSATGWDQVATISACANDGQPVRLGKIGTRNNQNVIDLEWSAVLALTQRHPHYQPIPTTMPIIEDLTLAIPVDMPVGEILEKMKTFSPLITHVELKDVYGRNFTFTVYYQNMHENITGEDVTPIRRQLVERLVNEGVALVGELQK